MSGKGYGLLVWHSLDFSLTLFLCTVSHELFAHSLCAVGRLWSVIGAIPGHVLYYFPNFDKMIYACQHRICVLTRICQFLYKLSHKDHIHSTVYRYTIMIVRVA